MTEETRVAAEFARTIVDGDAVTAHKLLSDAARKAIAPTDLSAQLDSLANELGGVTGIGEPSVILTEWPDMSENDRAMVYVPLEGDVYSEAITVTISAVDDALCISSIEWGRP